jgi:hypothetical protein
LLSLVLSLLAPCSLAAQLDPRLQAGRTDFLDLYQQSSAIRPKPEILTIFDFSGSMGALMYHPLYHNAFPADDDASCSMSFSLNTTTNAVSASMGVGGLALAFRALVKPDGTAVTKDDAEACLGLKDGSGATLVPAAAKGLYGSPGASNKDVRHWVMASSHARFSSGGRTIDIPIPWKVMDFNSRGNPLSSKVIRDEQVKVSAGKDGRIERRAHGSGRDIELDLNYRVAPGALGGGPGGAAQASLSLVSYKATYVKWLFQGKYQGASPKDPYYTADPRLAGRYIAFDAAASSDAYLAAGQASAEWGQGFRGQAHNGAMRDRKMMVPRYGDDGTYAGTAEDYAHRYATPAYSRAQASKAAAIQAWIRHQADVYWAFRFLDPGANEAGGGSAASIDNNSKVGIAGGDPLKTRLNGSDSGWTVLNNRPADGINSASGNSVKGMQRIAAAFTGGGAPLAYAMARALAQYNDPNSAFNEVLGEDAPQCANSFLILFADGADNSGGGAGAISAATPYISNADRGPDATFSAVQGNREIIRNKARINRAAAPGGNSPDYAKNTVYWNLFTFAAVGAHMADSSLGDAGADYMEALDPGPRGGPAKQGAPSSFLPFAIWGRNGTKYAKGHRVTTMTVGVSLGGRHCDADGPKRSLFLAAAMGDPGTAGGRLGGFRSFAPPTRRHDGTIDRRNDWLEDHGNPGAYPAMGKRAEGAVYFFDAQHPDALAAALDTAFNAAISAGASNSASGTCPPTVGASLGGQIYMGSFSPPDGGGAIWTGDLLMFGAREEGGSVKMIGRNGDAATALDAASAIWSAADAMKEKPWDRRALYTRLPGAPDHAPLKRFTDRGGDFDDPSTGLANYIDANQLAVVRFAMGGDTLRGPFDEGGRPTANRSTIMGDVINSAPAAIEYAWGSVRGKLGAHPRLSAIGGDSFRLILVGTNQGWLHAFGEVTAKTSATGPDGARRETVAGAVEELWAFMPTDFLKGLDHITHPGNMHRSMVDGPPTIYHLDLPPTTGGMGNGVVDPGERAVAVFGLGKGGRSYYALNIEDPFAPRMQWSLVPDEAAQFPSLRMEPNCGADIDSVRGILGSRGFSTAAPAVGRIVYGGTSRQIRDAVFLGGGLSVDEVDARFPDKNGRPTPLGRSVMALDAYTGNVLAAEDLAASFGGSVGPVCAGLVPFEFIVNSGMAQRAYFLDYSGGLWAWGANGAVDDLGSPYDGFREDTSEINKWGLRKVCQDTGAARGNRYTTQPAPFRVGSFPGAPKGGRARPAAVGIAMVSGDRNNPLDYGYTSANAPACHRLTVAFDRQDGGAWKNAAGMADGTITDGALADFSANIAYGATGDPCGDAVLRLITPGCGDYYLAPAAGDPKFGYYINFPPRAGGFTPKGIAPPTVVSGSLFYTIFTPTAADPCTGGLGASASWVVADAINPLKEDRRYDGDMDGVLMYSRLVYEWVGAASGFVQIGTRGVLQGGAPAGGGAPELRTAKAHPSHGRARPKVWRTASQGPGTAPRAPHPARKTKNGANCKTPVLQFQRVRCEGTHARWSW